jgi:hypothetical protein
MDKLKEFASKASGSGGGGQQQQQQGGAGKEDYLDKG